MWKATNTAIDDPSAVVRRLRGSGWLFKRKESRHWWAGYHRNGKLYRESTGTSKVQAAARFLRRRIAEAAGDNFIPPQTARIKIDELAEDVLRDYRLSERKSLNDATSRWLLHLKPFFGHLRALGVTSTLIQVYVDARLKEGAKNATINRELAFLKRAFNLGFRATPAKVARIPAFPKLAERNIRKGFVEDAEYQKVSAAAGRVGLWLKTLFEIGYAYGWRISELRNLRVEQIDLLNRTITLNGTLLRSLFPAHMADRKNAKCRDHRIGRSLAPSHRIQSEHS